VLGGPFAYDELSAPGAAVNAGFTAVWVVAVGVMAYGIYELHRFMAREKREEVRRLDDLAREQLETSRGTSDSSTPTTRRPST